MIGTLAENLATRMSEALRIRISECFAHQCRYNTYTDEPMSQLKQLISPPMLPINYVDGFNCIIDYQILFKKVWMYLNENINLFFFF